MAWASQCIPTHFLRHCGRCGNQGSVCQVMVDECAGLGAARQGPKAEPNPGPKDVTVRGAHNQTGSYGQHRQYGLRRILKSPYHHCLMTLVTADVSTDGADRKNAVLGVFDPCDRFRHISMDSGWIELKNS
ncbi:hypothetical protein B0H19DRAFT_1079249 [Mycena capillaripes]|nr:hypothetical protein B0H19DRAFT_1079249 [Mycena capillaripes]